MVVFGFNKRLKKPCFRKGLLKGKHKKYPMTVISLVFFDIALMPKETDMFYWEMLDKLASDSDYLIKNNDKVDEAIKQFKEKEKERLERHYRSQIDRLTKRNDELRDENDKTSNSIRVLKKAIKIVGDVDVDIEPDSY
jgi:hypothetical protein